YANRSEPGSKPWDAAARPTSEGRRTGGGARPIKRGRAALRPCRRCYSWGTAFSTVRNAWAAPRRAALSYGTTTLVLTLSANLLSVSSCRIATSVGSGSAAVIAEYTLVI